MDMLGRWAESFSAFVARFAGLFGRSEPREQLAKYLRALLATVSRKNGWQLAEVAGDADAARDVLRTYVVVQLGEPEGIGIVDETGFLKKSTNSVGVKRQYSGTAGRTENCQIGTFLAYDTSRGQSLIAPWPTGMLGRVGSAGYVLFRWNNTTTFTANTLCFPSTSPIAIVGLTVGGADGMVGAGVGRATTSYKIGATVEVGNSLGCANCSGKSITFTVADGRTHYITIDSPNYQGTGRPRGIINLKPTGSTGAGANFDFTGESTGDGNRIMQY